MLKTSTKHATSYISIILTLLGSSAWGSDYQDAFLRSTWIVVGKKSTADYAANLITSKGMPFALVAYAVSGDLGSSGSGGDLGITKCSSFVGPIAEVLCNAPFGTIIGPIQTEFGWSLHLVSGRADTAEALPRVAPLSLTRPFDPDVTLSCHHAALGALPSVVVKVDTKGNLAYVGAARSFLQVT